MSGDRGGGKPFEVVREFEVDAPPRRVWDAVTKESGGWLRPMEYEPKEGGTGPFHSVLTVWDPPRRLTARSDDPAALPPGQPLNQLDWTVEPRDGGGRSRVTYVHSGVFTEDWAERHDATERHTDFHLHTLRQYLTYFAGRAVAFAGVEGPAASANPEALTAVGRALDLPVDAAEGARVRVRGPEGQALDAVLDYRDAAFLGLRTEDALYRFFGRGRWGAPVGIGVHDFAADADARRNEIQWGDWLLRIFD
ncbi:SRPBCC family protein [Streptomyces sp. SDT5-1]|uniref:SRPBCC family protein n=1 Tax=Streptomyces sp. SDT5-1 TaxID=3406418 RepID=UPI003FD2106D